MLILHDRASFAHALTLDLDPPMRRALRRRVEGLSAGAYDLTDLTEIIVVQPGDTVDDLAREADFRPGADPLSGYPAWDYLTLHDGVWDAVFTFGSTFALILLAFLTALAVLGIAQYLTAAAYALLLIVLLMSAVVHPRTTTALLASLGLLALAFRAPAAMAAALGAIGIAGVLAGRVSAPIGRAVVRAKLNDPPQLPARHDTDA